MLPLSFSLKPYGMYIFPYENYLVTYPIFFMYLHEHRKVL